MFVADERGRFRRLCAAGLQQTPQAETLHIHAEARAWILDRLTFPLAGPATGRALGDVRNKLTKDYDGVVAAAVRGERGLLGLMVFGPPLLPGVTTTDSPILLETLAALTGQALVGHSPPTAADADPRLEAVAGAAGDNEPGAAARPSRARPSKHSRDLAKLRGNFPALETLVGESRALFDACEDLAAVSPTRFPVLLTGESGVGKELAASAVHQLSDRASGPFEVIDCGSIPGELIESELFGHVRGAFTGAQKDRRGAFELAHRGTLFLDEIGEMPLQLQTRLLRVLQEGRFRRVGDERLIDVDVRVVAATNRDLRDEVAARRFREDLYYRLNVFAVHMPSLRERPEDIGLLLEHFLTIQGRELGVRKWRLDEDVVQALQVYGWPGNIRELVNLCAALVVHSRGTGHVTMRDLAHVWKRQHVGQSAPWHEGALPAHDQVGQWVVEQARATRFNLVELARLLQRQKRAGQSVPVAERS
jgi:transcriptional regulator with AAA-type ATPase domain